MKVFSNNTEIISKMRNPLCAVIPYFGNLSVKMKNEASKLISESFPHRLSTDFGQYFKIKPYFLVQ